MLLAAQGQAITERLEVMDDAFCAVFGESMVRIGTALDRVKAGINVVPGRRTHRRRLETLLKTHAFGCELVDVGRVGLAAIAAYVTKCAVVGDNENEIGLGGFFDAE